MNRFIVTIALASISLFASAQYQNTGQGIKATVNEMDIRVMFYSQDIVRIVKTPANTQPAYESYAVIMEPGKPEVNVTRQGEIVEMNSQALRVRLHLETGKISFHDANGKNLLTEKDYGTQFTPAEFVSRTMVGGIPSGNPQSGGASQGGDAQPQPRPTFRIDTVRTMEVRQAFLLEENEVIYGLGQHQDGKMNQRGQRLILQQENMLISIPYFTSVKGYGLYWDNYSVTTFTDNPWECSFSSESGDAADYYFLFGGNGDQTVALLRQLTGQATLYPLWTYGFWQCKERYKSQDEVVEVVSKYRELGVPLDGIVQDWKYWGLENTDWNSLEFRNPEFPNPQEMLDKVHALNAKMMISVWPSFGNGTNIYNDMNQMGALIPIVSSPRESRAYDVFNSKANDLLWKYMNQNLFSLGMDAWWMDATEPEFVNSTPGNFNYMTGLGRPLRDVRNAYPLFANKAIYERQRALTDSKRVFLLTRSSYVGIQRYGAGSWSGDIRASWDVFRKQISGGLNFSFSGIPYWNTDIGAWHPFGNVYNTANTDPAYQQFYVRWFQFATFTPMLRSHGSGSPREIYQFGDRGYWAFDVQEQYINLRYAMLPYLYSTAWQITKNGYSYMRHLSMEAPHDKKVYNMDDEYMFGSAFLVAPVLEENAKTREVYLPNSSKWYDYWTEELLEGGQTLQKEVPIEIMPLYVKAGSIVPFNKEKVQYAEEKPWSLLEIKVYPGANADFVLYEDENDNYNYEKGVYSEIPLTWNESSRTLVLGARQGEFPGMLQNRKFVISVVGEKSKTIRYSGKETAVSF